MMKCVSESRVAALYGGVLAQFAYRDVAAKTHR